MNIINEIELDLTFASQVEAVKLNTEWSPYLEPMFEEVFGSFCNQFNRTEDVVFIEELVIDLGVLNATNISQKLVQFRTLLNEKLQEQVSGILQAKENNINTINWLEKPKEVINLSFNEKNQKEKKENIAQYTEVQNLVLTINHFLQFGNLPWWQENDGFDFDKSFFFLLQNEPEAIKNLLVKLSKESLNSIWRLFSHIEENTIEALFLLFSFSNIKIESIQKQINKQILNANKLEINNTLKILSNNKNVFLASLLTLLLEKKIDANQFSSIEELIHELVIFQENPVEENILINQFEDKLVTKYNVDFAGIILTAGFLNPYFKKLGLLDEQGFLSIEDQYKAVLALHFLATGSLKFTEHNMTMEKLLCGLDPEVFVPIDLHLDHELVQSEADDLLDSLIQQWKILKSTSITGLRQTFIKRKGLLEQNSETSWTLHVEKKTLDVILNFLPAGFPLSTIIFSWSKFILYVNWDRE